MVPVASGTLPVAKLALVDTLPLLAGGAAQVPSPRQKVVAEAPVPLFKSVTGRLPLTPVVKLIVGMRAEAIVPVLISEASMLLFVSVCVSEVPTMVPAGAATADVTFGAVRTTTPFAPGSAKPLLPPVEPEEASTVQVLVAVQAYKFRPAGAAMLKYMSPVVQVAGSDVPVFIGRV